MQRSRLTKDCRRSRRLVGVIFATDGSSAIGLNQTRRPSGRRHARGQAAVLGVLGREVGLGAVNIEAHVVVARRSWAAAAGKRRVRRGGLALGHGHRFQIPSNRRAATRVYLVVITRIPVAEVVLHGPEVRALVGHVMPAGMAQHVGPRPRPAWRARRPGR